MKAKQPEDTGRLLVTNGIVSPPHFEIFSNRRIIADGCFEIVGYTDDKILLKCKDNTFGFWGADIVIDSFGTESAELTGFFTKIEFS